MTSSEVIRLGIGTLVLLLVTGLVLQAGRVRLGYAPYTAVLRGGLQLALVGLALRVCSAIPLRLLGFCW